MVVTQSLAVHRATLADLVEDSREQFGKYHVLERIAQGGMAEVYKVKTVGIAGFEKIQALKRILPDSAQEDRFIRSFIDEARIAVELNHRNIVSVFDFGKAEGELYLAMELIEGKDLRGAVSDGKERGALVPPNVAAYVISEVAAGLDYAHRKTDGIGGAMGIVINRAANYTLGELLDQLSLPTDDPRVAGLPIVSGGPVHPDRGFVLHDDPREWNSTLRFGRGLAVTTSRDILAAMARGDGPRNALVALGYAGWTAGQLEEELAQNSWLTVPADQAIVFTTPLEQRWQAAASALGVDLSLLADYAGHA